MAQNVGAFVARNAKAVVSLIGGIISVLTVAVALLQYAPASAVGVGVALLTALEVLRTVNVWIVKNEPVLEAAADAAAELVESFTDAVGVSDSDHAVAGHLSTGGAR
ncbi:MULTISPECIES: hypothetical protein [unclassified Rhodococcus (in: high G+C Gram-positive bacteria)]|uniref:hypothetical protein n=1 Tax=unclassified Rhodococcus (in: high G+C Gram-positive bacteria) TaxID=192944 RepID=UPI001582AFD1|nr:hypothetical protein [Rhodococcus sp. W8901]QKT10042.1 hypothetical protein HUN07_04330 [Rhodococcus sp. W8901]